MEAVVITLSDRGAAGLREDLSGPAAMKELSALGFEVVTREVLPDDPHRLAERLVYWADQKKIGLILTTGGTGLAPTDLTPTALDKVCGWTLPAVEEVLLRTGLTHTPHAALSRSRAGVRGKTVVVALPGSPKAVREGISALAPCFSLLAHQNLIGGTSCIEP